MVPRETGPDTDLKCVARTAVCAGQHREGVRHPWKAGVQEQWGVLVICTPLRLTSHMTKGGQLREGWHPGVGRWSRSGASGEEGEGRYQPSFQLQPSGSCRFLSQIKSRAEQ